MFRRGTASGAPRFLRGEERTAAAVVCFFFPRRLGGDGGSSSLDGSLLANSIASTDVGGCALCLAKSSNDRFDRGATLAAKETVPFFVGAALLRLNIRDGEDISEVSISISRAGKFSCSLETVDVASVAALSLAVDSRKDCRVAFVSFATSSLIFAGSLMLLRFKAR